jgi:hypothetical protein
MPERQRKRESQNWQPDPAVIASREAKQSSSSTDLDCFAALAMTTGAEDSLYFVGRKAEP